MLREFEIHQVTNIEFPWNNVAQERSISCFQFPKLLVQLFVQFPYFKHTHTSLPTELVSAHKSRSTIESVSRSSLSQSKLISPVGGFLHFILYHTDCGPSKLHSIFLCLPFFQVDASLSSLTHIFIPFCLSLSVTSRMNYWSRKASCEQKNQRRVNFVSNFGSRLRLYDPETHCTYWLTDGRGTSFWCLGNNLWPNKSGKREDVNLWLVYDSRSERTGERNEIGKEESRKVSIKYIFLVYPISECILRDPTRLWEGRLLNWNM